MDGPRCLVGELHPRRLTEAEALHVIVETLGAQHPRRECRHPHVERGVQHPLQILVSVGPPVPVRDGDPAVFQHAQILVAPVAIDPPRVQSRRHGHQFEDGTRLVARADGGILEDALLSPCRILREAGRLIGRAGSQRQNRAGTRIHDDDVAPDGLILEEGLLQLTLDVGLKGPVEGETQIGPRVRQGLGLGQLVREGGRIPRHLTLQLQSLPANNAQLVGLHAVPHTLLIDETQQMRGKIALHIIPAPGGDQGEPSVIERLDGLRRLHGNILRQHPPDEELLLLTGPQSEQSLHLRVRAVEEGS